MPARLIVVTAPPTGAHWHIEIPGHSTIMTRTLVMAETITARRVTGAFDLQVRLGGLEDLCADAVELGQAADAAHIAALKARRVAVRTLKDAGHKPVDIGYLTGIPTETVDNLLTVPRRNTMDDHRDHTVAAPPTPPGLAAGRRDASGGRRRRDARRVVVGPALRR